jgi:hypothetical protein
MKLENSYFYHKLETSYIKEEDFFLLATRQNQLLINFAVLLGHSIANGAFFILQENLAPLYFNCFIIFIIVIYCLIFIHFIWFFIIIIDYFFNLSYIYYFFQFHRVMKFNSNHSYFKNFFNPNYLFFYLFFYAINLVNHNQKLYH